MAQFKMFLLNLKNNITNSIEFLAQPISEYNNTNQIKIRNNHQNHYLQFNNSNSYCYSFNEKFKEQINSQKTLTFSMLKNITRENRIEINPFIDYLIIGSQILFVDQFQEHHLMTVIKIDTDFNSQNAVYNYTCQDSFTYQLSRQNKSYEIINDITREDFLGAHTLDWWVINKIQPECNISYEYLILEKELKMFKNENINILHTIKHSINRNNVNLFKKIPFAAKGTADAILIQLAQNYGLQLKTYEHYYFQNIINQGKILKKKNTLDRYYWFEYSKNPKITGLTYSPLNDLKNIHLTHSGTSLSTIFNIKSVSKNDELISLIPEVPSFFNNYFRTPEWINSHFYNGLFTKVSSYETNSMISLEQNITITQRSEDNWTDNALVYYQDHNFYFDSKNSIFYLPLYSNAEMNEMKKSSFYSFIRFNHNNQYSEITLNLKNQDIHTFNSNIINWDIVYWTEDGTRFDKKEEEELVDFDKNIAVFLKLKLTNVQEVSSVNNYKIYWEFYRNSSKEEKEFAEIADQCPWLENKIIDCHYFLDHKILTKKQYQTLEDILYNKLRKVNANLLINAADYYKSIQNRTKLMAKLSSKIDQVQALFHSDLLDPYQENGKVKETNNFLTAINNLLDIKNNNISMINFDNVLSDYVNKYVNAEQNFLKNMYNFKKFFYSNKDFDNITEYNYRLSFDRDQNYNFFNTEIIPINGKEYRYTYLLDSPNTELFIDQYNNDPKSNFYGKPNNTIYKKIDNKYIPISSDKILWKEKFEQGEYYRLIKNQEGMKEASDYHRGTNYYEKVLKQKVPSNDFILTLHEKDSTEYSVSYDMLVSILQNHHKKSLISKDDLWEIKPSLEKNYIIFKAAYSYLVINKDTEIPSSIQFQFSNSNQEYIILTYTVPSNDRVYDYQLIDNKSILRHYLYKNRDKIDFLQQYYIFNKDNYSTINWLTSIDSQLAYLMRFQSEAKNWTDYDEVLKKELNICWEHYKECFPLNQIFFKDQDYHPIDFVNINNYQNFYRRIDVSQEERQAWSSSTEITKNTFFNKVKKTFNNNNSTIGNTGWTTKNIFGKTFEKSEDFFQGYHDMDDLIYFKTQEDKLDLITENYTNWKDFVLSAGGWTLENAQNFLTTYQTVTANRVSTDGTATGEKVFTEYYYRANYWKIIYINQNINSSGHYKVILTKDENECFNSTWIQQKRYINKYLYYPLNNILEDLLLPQSIFQDKSFMTLKQALEFSGFTVDPIAGSGIDNLSPWVAIYLDGNKKEEKLYLMCLKDDDYQITTFNDIAGISHKLSLPKIERILNEDIYNIDNDLLINPLVDFSNVCKDFYILTDSNQGYQLNKTDYDIEGKNKNELKAFDIKEKYFIYQNGTYNPLETVGTLQNNNTVIATFLDKHFKTYFPIQNQTINFQVYKEEKLDDGSYSAPIFDRQIEYTLDFPSTPSEKINSLPDHEDIKYKITAFNPITIQEINNGNFWIKHINDNNNPLAQQQALFIETTLTEYWNNAFLASKRCKFFLPESWNNTLNNNYFINDILIKIDGTDDLELNSKYIPNIQAIQNKPWYIYNKISKVIPDMHKAANYNLEVENKTDLKSICNSNDIIRNTFNYLKLNIDEWEATEINNTTYYQLSEGGMTWNSIVKWLSGNQIDLEFFGGWNDLMIHVLQNNNFKNYENTFYKEAVAEHNQIWKDLYTRFPNVLLEQEYSNDTATNSLELLELSKRAFLDYKNLEKQYNVSVINLNGLKGYKGQSLHIGDSIQLEVSEIYDHIDDTTKALKQFLFITDISYDLRDESQTTITVNDIKYQDKILTQLIKLIR